MNSPRVVFLGGLGRSGTTLVERLLAALPGVCAVGEVVHLWQRGLVDGERCGCGEPFGDCPFWEQVGAVAFGGWGHVDPRRVLALKQAIDRTRFVPTLAGPLLPGGLRRRLDEYVALYAGIYAAVARITGASVLIDSSKHASLAFCLRWSRDIDLRVVHVVRDARAVAYSWTKQVRRPEGGVGEQYMTRFTPARTAVHWNAQNLAFHLLGLRGTPTRVLRYERFLADPTGALRGLAAFVGVPLGEHGNELEFLHDGYAELPPAHTVSGNPMRFRTGQVLLRQDEEWRSRLPVGQRRLVTALTSPLLAGYGYLRSRGTS